ncbi:uncharacterized protein LOC123592654 isoform X2 [Leopardus geoffroyi]|uniref:uncharacterized protein LOC123592654 isoform X2 n=1 Tax=Leopardus geoffroyi TaxID=46844 RepID=UPI001E25FA54|nr:uncharacterized protein LOC123592654 isoform X2 [Leopardus geoffroyi]
MGFGGSWPRVGLVAGSLDAECKQNSPGEVAPCGFAGGLQRLLSFFSREFARDRAPGRAFWGLSSWVASDGEAVRPLTAGGGRGSLTSRDEQKRKEGDCQPVNVGQNNTVTVQTEVERRCWPQQAESPAGPARRDPGRPLRVRLPDTKPRSSKRSPCSEAAPRGCLGSSFFLPGRCVPRGAEVSNCPESLILNCCLCRVWTVSPAHKGGKCGRGEGIST